MKNRIKELREEKNMTQVRLAIELGVSQETISAYEMGKHYPSVASLIKTAHILDSSIDYILGLSDVKKPIDEKCIPDDEVSLLSLFRSLHVHHKEKAIAFMQGLYSS